MLQRYLRHSRGLPWLQFPVLLALLTDAILKILTRYISLTMLDILAGILLLDTTVEILYRKTNISLFGILVVVLDLGVLVSASMSFTIIPLAEMGDPFNINIPLIIYTVFHVLKRFGIDNWVLYLADFLIFTKALPESFPCIFNSEFGVLMAFLVCVYGCRSPHRRPRGMGAAGVRVMAGILLVLTPTYFILGVWHYIGLSLFMVTYTLGALWILILVPGHSLDRFFSTTPLVLSATGGDMIGATTEAVQPEQSRNDIGTVINTRPLVGIDTPWVILDDDDDDDSLGGSSGSDSDLSAPRIPPVFRTIRDRRTPRGIDDPMPLPPSPGEVAAAEASRRRARRYQTGHPPTSPVSDLAGVTDGQSTLPPFRWGSPTGNLPESGTTNTGFSRLRQRLTKLAAGQEGAGGIGTPTPMPETAEGSPAGLSTTRAGGVSQPITQQELPPGFGGVEGEGEEIAEGDDEIPEVGPPGSLKLPTLFPAGLGRRVITSSDTTSVGTVSPSDPGSSPLGQPWPLPIPNMPLPPPPPQPPRVRFTVSDSEERPRRRRFTPSRFVERGHEPGPAAPTISVEDPFFSPPTASPITAPVSPTAPGTADPRDPRPPARWQPESTPIASSLNREQQPSRINTRGPGARRSPLLADTFVDPNERAPTPATTATTSPPVTPENRRPRPPTDWQFESTSTTSTQRGAPQPDRTGRTRRPRPRQPPQVRQSSLSPDGGTTNPAPTITSRSTTPSPEAPLVGHEGREVSETMLGLEFHQDLAERITRIPVPRGRRMGGMHPSPLPPPGMRPGDGSGSEQSESQTPAPTLAETQTMEVVMAGPISDSSVRILSRGRDGRITEGEGSALEIARRQSLIDLQQRDISLPLFRQRGSAGGESSAVGGVIGNLGNLSEEHSVEEDEEPYEGRGKGRARRRT